MIPENQPAFHNRKVPFHNQEFQNNGVGVIARLPWPDFDKHPLDA